ncbi:MAG: DegT/DnrJ/EryC1/StrS family aminotransferase [Leptospiraceae bacterium]|nr:DegT/DnrJ/EryC1/StrS family aminotransferase [Leptospiraceae bacterium]
MGLFRNEKKSRPIEAHRPTLSKQELESVLNCLIEDRLGSGQITRRFEKTFVGTADYRHALAVNSLVSAYHLVFLGMGIRPGDHVIMSAAASIQACDAARYIGARIHLLDIARGSFHPDPEHIYRLVEDLRAASGETDSTDTIGTPDPNASPSVDVTEQNEVDPSSATVNVTAQPDGQTVEADSSSDEQNQIFYIMDHTFGSPATVDAAVLREKNVRIIEDFTGLVGSDRDGEFFGKSGHAAVCGFSEYDLITTGNGAMVVTPDSKLYKRMFQLRYGAKREKGSLAYDYRLEDFQAAIGLDQLSRLGITLSRRKKIGMKYLESLRTTAHETFFREPDVDAYLKFPVVFNRAFDEVQRYFTSLQIGITRAVETPLHHLLELPRMEFPNTERLYQRGVSIPLYPGLTANNVERIGSSLRGLI